MVEEEVKEEMVEEEEEEEEEKHRNRVKLPYWRVIKRNSLISAYSN